MKKLEKYLSLIESGHLSHSDLPDYIKFDLESFRQNDKSLKLTPAYLAALNNEIGRLSKVASDVASMIDLQIISNTYMVPRDISDYIYTDPKLKKLQAMMAKFFTKADTKDQIHKVPFIYLYAYALDTLKDDFIDPGVSDEPGEPDLPYVLPSKVYGKTEIGRLLARSGYRSRTFNINYGDVYTSCRGLYGFRFRSQELMEEFNQGFYRIKHGLLASIFEDETIHPLCESRYEKIMRDSRRIPV